MKVQVVSDLHLEFRTDYPRIKNAGADMLILSGDICLVEHLWRNPTAGMDYMIQKGWYADDARRYREFFNYINNEFELIVYVLGNHEHYNGRWNDNATRLSEMLDPFSNIVLMNDSWINYKGYRIIGTTLWTDLNNGDPLTMAAIRDMMTDYKAITINNNGNYHKLRPVDTFQAHKRAVDYIKLGVSSWNGPVIVVGHHAPSFMSVHNRFKGTQHHIMNGAFASSLDNYIANNPQIKLWTHGHVHNRFDYMIGETRVFCNPMGYPNEVGIDEWQPELVLEI